MNAGTLAKTNDRNEKAKRRSLQWLFSSSANETCDHRISDRRDAGVCGKAFNESTAVTGKSVKRSGADRDGLLASLLVEQFFSTVLCPFLPAFLQGADLISTVDAADEIWLDRRKAKSAETQYERSYFPSYALY